MEVMPDLCSMCVCVFPRTESRMESSDGSAPRRSRDRRLGQADVVWTTGAGCMDAPHATESSNFRLGRDQGTSGLLEDMLSPQDLESGTRQEAPPEPRGEIASLATHAHSPTVIPSLDLHPPRHIQKEAIFTSMMVLVSPSPQHPPLFPHRSQSSSSRLFHLIVMSQIYPRDEKDSNIMSDKPSVSEKAYGVPADATPDTESNAPQDQGAVFATGQDVEFRGVTW